MKGLYVSTAMPMLKFYSVRKLFTGLVSAALIAWKLIVNNAIIAESNPAIKNTHHEISTRYAKSSNHECIANHATGKAISEAIATNFKKSLDNITTMLPAPAPNTFLIPISLMRCCVLYAARPSKPMQPIKIASTEKMVNIFCVVCSALYCSAKFLSRKE